MQAGFQVPVPNLLCGRTEHCQPLPFRRPALDKVVTHEEKGLGLRGNAPGAKGRRELNPVRAAETMSLDEVRRQFHAPRCRDDDEGRIRGELETNARKDFLERRPAQPSRRGIGARLDARHRRNCFGEREVAEDQARPIGADPRAAKQVADRQHPRLDRIELGERRRIEEAVPHRSTRRSRTTVSPRDTPSRSTASGRAHSGLGAGKCTCHPCSRARRWNARRSGASSTPGSSFGTGFPIVGPRSRFACLPLVRKSNLVVRNVQYRETPPSEQGCAG